MHMALFASSSNLFRNLACAVDSSRLSQVWQAANFVEVPLSEEAKSFRFTPRPDQIEEADDDYEDDWSLEDEIEFQAEMDQIEADQEWQEHLNSLTPDQLLEADRKFEEREIERRLRGPREH